MPNAIAGVCTDALLESSLQSQFCSWPMLLARVLLRRASTFPSRSTFLSQQRDTHTNGM